MESFDIMKYLDMALRRKWWIIIPFLLTVLGGLTYALKSPRIYEAQTLILVQPQKVPKEFIRSIVSIGVEERLKTITQQVTSRTNLESIIKEYKLYNDSKMILEAKVALLRKRIRINVVRGDRGGNAFEITLRGKDPEKITRVTNALASNFISENLKIRESQALGTSIFLADELESIRKRLASKEKQLREYRQKFMGALPEQLQTNLNILGRLQMQLEQLNNSLRDAENRRLIIQKQIADSEMLQKQLAGTGSRSFLEGGAPDDLISLRKQLSLLRGRYTANHPDIIRLKKMIATIEAEEIESKTEPAESEAGSTELKPVIPMTGPFLRPQLQQINLETKNIKAEIKKVQSRMELYQRRVEDTPKREQELLSINRDYENIRELYNSILNRKLEAEIAVSMEKKQKGEQFRVIDPAKTPHRPIEPDIRKIFLMTLIIGLGLGVGLAYLVEIMDTSFKVPEEVEKETQLPVLVSMPIQYTEKELKDIKRKNALAFASVALGFIFSVFIIVFAVKGVDTTVDFLKNIIKKI